MLGISVCEAIEKDLLDITEAAVLKSSVTSDLDETQKWNEFLLSKNSSTFPVSYCLISWKSAVSLGLAETTLSSVDFWGNFISFHWIVFGTVTLALVVSVRNSVVSPFYFGLRTLEIIEFMTLYRTL